MAATTVSSSSSPSPPSPPPQISNVAETKEAVTIITTPVTIATAVVSFLGDVRPNQPLPPIDPRSWAVRKKIAAPYSLPLITIASSLAASPAGPITSPIDSTTVTATTTIDQTLSSSSTATIASPPSSSSSSSSVASSLVVTSVRVPDIGQFRVLPGICWQALLVNGFTVIDNFIGDTKLVAAMRSEAIAIQQQGWLKDAGTKVLSTTTKTLTEAWKAAHTRGDVSCWLAGRGDLNVTSGPALQTLMTRVSAIRDDLARVCGTSFISPAEHTQIQLACYEGDGKRLKRHRDAYPGGPSRRLTAILYLNTEWCTSHAGCLRVYPASGLNHIDIEPIADRLVIFPSMALDHEVLPSFATRFAVTSWWQ